MSSSHQTYFSINGQDTIIGSDVTLEGSLKVAGDLRVEGAVIGSVTASGGLIIGVNAQLTSDIQADTASISGKIIGNIRTAGQTTIREMGSVNGDIDSERLTIMPGGLFEGTSRLNIAEGLS